MNESSNTLKDLLSEQQLREYLSKEYPFNTNFLGQILKEKLRENPDYEVWVPLFYCKYKLRRKNLDLPSVTHYPLVLISNKGKVIKYKAGSYVLLPAIKFGKGYLGVAVDNGMKKSDAFPLHRALASVFIPLPPELKLWHPKDLQVNHIDGVKSNFELDNLEWVTDQGNTAHAVNSGLIKSGKDSACTKPVKGRVEFGIYVGHEFILHGQADYKKHGLTQQNIVRCCKGRVRTHVNCSWTYATTQDLKELPHGLSVEIMDSLPKVAKRKNKA